MGLDTSKTIGSVTYNGVAFSMAGSDNNFPVTFSTTESGVQADHTYSEIHTALLSGKSVYGTTSSESSQPYFRCCGTNYAAAKFGHEGTVILFNGAGNSLLYAVYEDGYVGTISSDILYEDDVPPYPVTSVNSKTGAVELDFTVTATLASLGISTATVDKTLAEIEAAYQEGKNLNCVVVLPGDDGASIKLQTVERFNSNGSFLFSGFGASYLSDNTTYFAVFLHIGSDDNTFTTKTLT